MTETEIDLVVTVLCASGGTSWYSADRRSDFDKGLRERYRGIAREVIAALDRHRAERRFKEEVSPVEHLVTG
jgi:hypothetical protein